MSLKRDIINFRLGKSFFIFYFANVFGEIQDLRFAKLDIYKFSTLKKKKNAPPIVVYYVKIDQKLYITYDLSPK